MPRHSLSARILVWVIPVIVLVTGATATVTYLAARQAVLAEAARGIEAFNEAAAAQAKSFFEQRNNDLAMLGESPLFRDHYMTVEYDLQAEARVHRREIERMLCAFSARTKTYPRIRYAGADGAVITEIRDGNPAPSGGGLSPETLAELKSLRPGQRFVLGPKRLPGHPAPVMRYGQGLFDASGRLRGAIVLDASLSGVYGVLDRLRLGANAKSYLTRREPWQVPGLESRYLGGKVSATSVIAGTDWAIVTSVEYGDMLERMQLVGAAAFWVSVLAALLTVVILSRRLRFLLRPLTDLSVAARALGAGAWSMRVAVPDSPEIAELARAFNVMADDLSQRTQDLHQRVEELTAIRGIHEAVLKRLGRARVGEACLRAALAGLGRQAGELYWVEQEDSDIIVERSSGPGRRRLDEDDALRMACDSERPLRFDDERGRRVREETGMGAFHAVAVRTGTRCAAVLCVEARSEDESQRLAVFASAIGVALENSVLIEETARSEARYRMAVDNSPYAIVGLDAAGGIVLWNPRAEALFGLSAEEARGKALSCVLDAGQFQAAMARAAAAQGADRSEMRGRSRDDAELALSVAIVRQGANRENAEGWFVVLEDLTETKRLQGQLIQAEKMTAVGNLIAGVAHELNNPLGAVTGFAELLKDLPGTAEEREDLRHMYASALRCRDIVQGLLHFARQGKPEIFRVSLNQATQASIALFEYRMIKSEGVVLESEFDSADPEVAGNFQRIQQVLVNLLSNAVDALRGAPGKRMIRVKTESRPGEARLIVEDTGPGIPRAHRERIFTPFFTTKTAGKGTGLGLSISRQIVEEFGGTLALEDCGQGARFVVSLPPAPAGLPTAPEAGRLPPSLPGSRVLVVDDEPEVAQLMVRFLREDGMIPTAVRDAKEALRRLRKGGIDLVISDVDLGETSGLELYSAVRKMKSGATLPFILVTGDVLNASLTERMTELKAPVLAKPFLRTEFLRVVRRSLGAAPSQPA